MRRIYRLGRKLIARIAILLEKVHHEVEASVVAVKLIICNRSHAEDNLKFKLRRIVVLRQLGRQRSTNNFRLKICL